MHCTGEKPGAPLVYSGNVRLFCEAPEAVSYLREEGYDVVSSLTPAMRSRVVAVVWGDEPFGSAEAEEFPALRVLARFGTGIDAIAVNELEARGIAVERAPNSATVSVAEFSLAMIILGLRRLGPHISALRRNTQWRPEPPGNELNGPATVGIVGCGHIGLATARLLNQLGTRLVLWNRTWPPDPQRGSIPLAALRTSTLDELVGLSDLISVHVALNHETRGFIGRGLFEKVESAGRPIGLVNTARGPVVDEAALLRALDTGVVTSAALDVWSVEGGQCTDETILRLRRHPRVVPTPHVAAYTVETTRRCARECAEQIVRSLHNSQDR